MPRSARPWPPTRARARASAESGKSLARPGLATYAGARESLERLKSIGINCVYTHNYGCEPGSHLSFAQILQAADDVGMLVALSQPHFSHYDWRLADAGRTNGYARHAEHYVRVAANHPSVVFYAMSHNATGYDEDMNPDLIDGRHDPRNSRSRNSAALALHAEEIVRRLDPSRIVYHHSSGNLGAMHTMNFYPNFVPIQELPDWFEHWATDGARLAPDEVLIAGPGAEGVLAAGATTIANWLKSGGNVLAVGLDEQAAHSFLPFLVRTRRGEHISAEFEPAPARSWLAGVGPSDVHSRDPRVLPLITGGGAVTVVGDGLLARADGANVVFCQLVPWEYSASGRPNLKRTFRRAAFLLSRLLANLNVGGTTPVPDRFATPLAASSERRWLEGLYLDQPAEWDDPYRFFRW
jgi:hypothetical protein